MTNSERELPTERARTTLASVKKEMDEPRLAESVRKVLESDSLPVVEVGSAKG
jgi:hypothetical protein